MPFTPGTFVSPADGTTLATYAWGDALTSPRGVVQISHGLAEHSARYDRLAQALVTAGFRVRSADHRGHGRSIASGAAPGDFGTAGFQGLIDDVAAFGAQLSADAAGAPLFLIAHSMGSFAAQHVILDHSQQYAGVVLTGSSALDVMAANMTPAEDAAASSANGAAAPTGLEAFNVGFEHRTGYEWLSRDEAEVDAYVADPLCGFALPEDTMGQLFIGLDRLADPAVLRGIRSDLPMLIASGQDDPLAGGGALIELLAQRYREAGIADLTVRLYGGARHEIFNETNRDEVTGDVVAWLTAHS